MVNSWWNMRKAHIARSGLMQMPEHFHVAWHRDARASLEPDEHFKHSATQHSLNFFAYDHKTLV